MPNHFDLGGLVHPWGRNAGEYEAFFNLSDVSASARILDCGAGPASFAAEWGRRGRFVVAADPAYGRPKSEIAADFPATAERMLAGMLKARDRFRWDHYGTPERVIETRRAALDKFLDDFQSLASRGRYVAARLPELPFPPDLFDLVLCGHLLFLYSNELHTASHLAFIKEMLRVGREVRIFPLLDMDGRPSIHVEAVLHAPLSARMELVMVPFEFRIGDSRMLRLTK
jgi:ubiquinone/menaquinone biosynthesis C-methylase UbiE